MSTHFISHLDRGRTVDDRTHGDALRFIAPLGRALLAAIFVLSSIHHFQGGAIVAYAASAGVPMPGIAVPLSGILALLGGLSVLFGFKTRIGAVLLAVFLVPVTLFMHRFWGLSDPQMAMMQQVNFLKNQGLLGGALLLFYFGPGPVSFDERRSHRP